MPKLFEQKKEANIINVQTENLHQWANMELIVSKCILNSASKIRALPLGLVYSETGTSVSPLTMIACQRKAYGELRRGQGQTGMKALLCIYMFFPYICLGSTELRSQAGYSSRFIPILGLIGLEADVLGESQIRFAGVFFALF